VLYSVCLLIHCHGSNVVLEPDPQENRKGGLGDRLGRKCTVRLECRCTSDWFVIACLRVFIGNANCNSLVQFKETENKQDLLAREVVEHKLTPIRPMDS